MQMQQQEMPRYQEGYTIPSRFVGLVIGRGGESIKRLQHQSHCRISINTDSEGADKECTIMGSQENVGEAKRMLDDIIRRGIEREQRNAGQFQEQRQ